VNIDKSTERDEIEKVALNVENVMNFISTSEIKKTIYIENKLINFVI
jgi:leucyl-tRNA synthetase